MTLHKYNLSNNNFIRESNRKVKVIDTKNFYAGSETSRAGRAVPKGAALPAAGRRARGGRAVQIQRTSIQRMLTRTIHHSSTK